MAQKILKMTKTITECQSLVHSSHSKLEVGKAIWWNWKDEDVDKVKTVLTSLFEQVNFGIPNSVRSRALQLAFSAEGLHSLGIAPEAIKACGGSFAQGITTTRLNRALGDLDAASPSNWYWSDRTTYLMLLVYADTEKHLVKIYEKLTKMRDEARIKEIHTVTTRLPSDGREPFGFADGISNIRPNFGESAKRGNADLVPPGEVVLGLPDALGVTESKGWLGDGGSFLVGREIQQDVRSFWAFWSEKGGDEENAVWLASKAMGRWPNGMPITGSTAHEQPEWNRKKLDFDFVEDRYGDQCPLGSHIRRANPRNGLDPEHPERSARITSAHRLLRRGRRYGAPAPAKWFPKALKETSAAQIQANPEADRGLLFICLVGDIARQFEFVQQTWLNNSRFVNLSGGVDPISAGQRLFGDEGIFVLPECPIRQRINGLRSFTLVQGGGYFLLPSKSALKQIISSFEPSE